MTKFRTTTYNCLKCDKKKYNYTTYSILRNWKEKTPLELSLISSKTFSSSSKSFCSFGILSSSFGIKSVEVSHSFSNSMIFDESWNGKRKGKKCVFGSIRQRLPYLFKFILKFLDLLLHVLQIFPIFDILPFKLLKLFFTTSELIIQFLTIQNKSLIMDHPNKIKVNSV